MTELVYTVCPRGCRLHVDKKSRHKVTGNSYPEGGVYGKKGPTTPTRIITPTVKIRGASITRVSVKIDHEIPKEDIFTAMRLLDGTILQVPAYVGDIIVPNLLGPGVNFVVMYSLAKVSDAR